MRYFSGDHPFSSHLMIDKKSDIILTVKWPSGRASDSGARGRGFDPHSGRRVVSLSKIHLPPKKCW